MNTTPILLDDSIALVDLVRGLASVGLAVRGDRRGGLIVTQVSRAARAVECNTNPHLRVGAGGATIPCRDCKGHGADPMSDNANWLPCRTCHGTGAVANHVRQTGASWPTASNEHARDIETPLSAGCGRETSPGDGPCQPVSASHICHEHSYIEPCPVCAWGGAREDYRDGLDEEQRLRADDDRQRAHDINTELRLLGL